MNTSIDSNDDGAELQAVMGDYFDALLHESAQSAAQSVAVDAVTKPAAAVVVGQAVAGVTPLPVVSVAPCGDTAVPPLSDTVATGTVSRAAAETETAAPDNAQPAAAPSYQLIRIGGLTLGIPTQCIAEIVAAPPQWTPLGDARNWVLGNHSDGTKTYTVADTAALLVPGGALQAVAVGSNAVLLAGQPWALACDSIGEQITPDPAQVNWRGAQGKRPWLAGTVRAPTCALLDIPELIRLLEA